MSAPKGTCVDCGRDVTRMQTAIHEVRGYERDRAQGGTNHVLGRVRVDGRIWHEHCFDSWMRKHRGDGQQGALL